VTIPLEWILERSAVSSLSGGMSGEETPIEIFGVSVLLA
jgi:hypothetical protein